MDQTAVILVNVGTPDSPAVADVRRYLFQFLNDRRVIDLPWLLQKILVNLIIVPFRAPNRLSSIKNYGTKRGHRFYTIRRRLRRNFNCEWGVTTESTIPCAMAILRSKRY